MRRTQLSRWLALLGLSALLVLQVSVPARADEPVVVDSPADSKQAYDAVIAEGLQHFGAARWQAAYEAFGRAHFLHPSARTQRGLGMAAFNLGHLALARRHLEAALEASDAPLTAQQHDHVLQLLAQARARTGRYTVHANPAHAELELDGQYNRERVLLLDIGQHGLSLHAAGKQSLRRTLEVRGGEDETLELELLPADAGASPAAAPLPAAPVLVSPPPAAVAVPQSAGSAPPSPRASPTPWGAIVLGVSAAVLTGAVVTAVLEQGKESDLDVLCPDRVCEPDRAARAMELSSEIGTLQTVTDALLLTALVGAACGSWLLLSAGDDQGDALSARPRLGPGELGVTLAGRL